MYPRSNIGLSVMTWYIYDGTDLTPLFSTTPQEVPQRVTEVYRQFLATNMHERAKAIARQIALKKPDIVGLQEAVIVELIPPNAHKVVYNFVDILLCELARLGIRYRAAAQNVNSTITLPASTGNLVRLIDRNVILVRRESDVEIISTKAANYATNYQVQIGGRVFTILRGWVAVDALIRGKKFRLVNTQLEPLSSQVQVSQANELIAGPANTKLPLILLGDFNSNASVPGSQVYALLTLLGFKDTWVVGGIGNGFTAFQDSDVLNALSSLSKRIDFIFTRNGFDAIKDELVGESQEDRTCTRLWPSTHAGVFSRLQLGC
ncbi:endonuclease/exonuclease/phosphatase family protein [Clostridium paridis]|uniref:Endonuclease/exonuclease/phosphatase family protein n=1 Tax=Clostridium paridis TaxID=2803863 RepID=A0A937K660_9CLOT|nr:endonuclease/exonuclease/phosphatase family protein [Clostridium paridis]MBL4933225.1 endonuclease/exonuclease/phosphatase family protein [Clostridium paridis]